MSDVYIIHTDGGARGNPGPAAIGYTIEHEGKIVARHGQTIPATTNNQAEYQAIIQALTAAHGLGAQQIELRSDSELVIRQLKGEYKVKNKELGPLFIQVKQLLLLFSNIVLQHVPRTANEAADSLVNQALDEQA